jgi:hypothetical protein
MNENPTRAYGAHDYGVRPHQGGLREVFHQVYDLLTRDRAIESLIQSLPARSESRENAMLRQRVADLQKVRDTLKSG